MVALLLCACSAAVLRYLLAQQTRSPPGRRPHRPDRRPHPTGVACRHRSSPQSGPGGRAGEEIELGHHGDAPVAEKRAQQRRMRQVLRAVRQADVERLET